MNPGLAPWLLERLAHHEQIASAATQGPWTAVVDYEPWDMAHVESTPTGEPIACCSNSGCGPTGTILVADARHIAQNNPTLVLADIAAKRAIVESFQRIDEEAQRRDVLRPGKVDGEDLGVLGVAAALQAVVRMLALPFADDPGYRKEWKP